MTFNEFLSSLEQHALHTYFVWGRVSCFLCANQVFIFTTFCIKQGHEIKLQTWRLTINPCRSLPTISTMDYGSRGKTHSLKDRFWEKRSSEVKVDRWQMPTNTYKIYIFKNHYFTAGKHLSKVYSSHPSSSITTPQLK